MSLEDLTDKAKKIHLICSDSAVLTQFATDQVRSIYNTPLNAFFDVKTKKNVENMRELIPLKPQDSEKWVFQIDYPKLKSQWPTIRSITSFAKDSALFVINTEKYIDYKRLRGSLPGASETYLNSFHFKDVKYLFPNLSGDLVSFISSAYGREPEKILDLKRLSKAEKVSTRSDIIRLIGATAGTTTDLAIKMIKDTPKSAKSQRILIKNRLSAGHELIDSYGVFRFHRYLSYAFRDILDIKILYQSGVIYDSIRGLPEEYDEKRLSRYSRYMDIIRELALDRILWLNRVLDESGPWYSELQYQEFVYRIYQLPTLKK